MATLEIKRILTDINRFLSMQHEDSKPLVDAAQKRKQRKLPAQQLPKWRNDNTAPNKLRLLKRSSGQPVPVKTTPIGITSTPDDSGTA